MPAFVIPRRPRDVVRASLRRMKVVEGLSGGIAPGSVVSMTDLSLPVNGTNGVLLVFWKST